MDVQIVEWQVIAETRTIHAFGSKRQNEKEFKSTMSIEKIVCCGAYCLKGTRFI